MSKSKFTGQAIVIPGEASETDEETEIDDDSSQRSSTSANLPKKPTPTPVGNTTQFNFGQKPKHDSLLHRKLRDAQINLAVDAADFTGRTTQQMNVEAQRVAQSVYASQLSLQDATCHIRSIAEDLYKIDNNLDAVFNSHAMIPELTNFDNYPTVKRYSKAAK